MSCQDEVDASSFKYPKSEFKTTIPKNIIFKGNLGQTQVSGG